MPAAELEDEITDRRRQLLGDRAASGQLLAPDAPSAGILARRLQHCDDVARIWPSRPAAERRRLVLTLLQRVNVSSSAVSLHVDPAGLGRVADGRPPTLATPSHDPREPAVFNFPLSHGHTKGGHKRVPGDVADRPAHADSKVARILPLAHACYARICSADDDTPFTTLARESRVTLTYFTKVVRLAWLAPDITAA